jgi:hypothetical protein
LEFLRRDFVRTYFFNQGVKRRKDRITC